MAIAIVGRIFVGTEQVTRCGQPQASGGTGGHDHGFGADDDGFRGTGVDADHPGNLAVRVFQQPRGGVAVFNLHPVTAQAAVQDLLDVVAFRHGQHVGAQVVDLLHVVVAGFVFLEVNAPGVQLLDHRE